MYEWLSLGQLLQFREKAHPRAVTKNRHPHTAIAENAICGQGSSCGARAFGRTAERVDRARVRNIHRDACTCVGIFGAVDHNQSVHITSFDDDIHGVVGCEKLFEYGAHTVHAMFLSEIGWADSKTGRRRIIVR